VANRINFHNNCDGDAPDNDPNSPGIKACEVLTEIARSKDSNVLEKNFCDSDGNIIRTVWCIIGEDAQDFHDMVHIWLRKKGYKPD
jgi:hypothetical protein